MELDYAAVVHTMRCICVGGGLFPKYLDAVDLAACYLAGAVHDLQHHGLTNAFLVATEHPLAITYSDRAPQVHDVLVWRQ